MAQVTSVEAIVDLRVASGNVSQGQFKIVKGDIDGKPNYAIFANDEYIGSFEASTEQEAVCEGLTKIRELLDHLRLDKAVNLTLGSYADIAGEHTAQAVQVIVDKVQIADLEQAIQDMSHGICIDPDGTVKRVQPKNGSTFTRKELHSFVGGNTEYVSFTNDLHMYIKNESLLEGLPLNAKATALFWKHQEYHREQGTGLHGSVFIVKPVGDLY